MRYYAEKLTAVAEGRSLRGLESHRVLQDYRVALQQRLDQDTFGAAKPEYMTKVFSNAASDATSEHLTGYHVANAVDENNIQIEDMRQYFEWFVITYASGGIRSLSDTKQVLEDLVMYYAGHYIGLRSMKGKTLSSVKSAKELAQLVKPVYDMYEK